MHPADSSLRWLALSVPKRGHADHESEDAWRGCPRLGRFAVADGASESCFAALWARLLTEGFIAVRRPRDLGSWLEASRRQWFAEVMPLALPWYAEIKREEGAFATLLGVRARWPTPDRPGRWQAVAVGDSCLFRVREGRGVRAFPIKQSSEFSNLPCLIGSRTGPIVAPKRSSGSLRPGDRLLLMTDALAQWFLCAQETGGRPWEAVTRLLSAAQPEDEFTAWIEELRTRNSLRNDDVTLLVIEPGPTATE
jgi:hypothetical protein